MIGANSPSSGSATAHLDRPKPVGDRTYRIATVASGLILATLGACVIAGWLTDRIVWIRLGCDGPVMRFNTALLIVATGSALISLAFHRFTVMHLIGAVMVGVATTTALQYPLGLSFGIDELFFVNHHTDVPLAGARISVNGATCFALLGCAFCAMRSSGRQGWRFFLTALLASAVLAISAVAIYGHAAGLTAAFGWGGTYGLAMPTTMGVVVGAAWLMVWAARYQTQLGIPASKWFPLLVGNTVIIGTFILWHSLEFQGSERIREEVRAQFEYLCRDLASTCRHHEGVVVRMAERWDIADRPPEAAWRADALNYVTALNGLKAIAWVDSSLEARWFVGARDREFVKMAATDKLLRETIQAARRKYVTMSVESGTLSQRDVVVWLCQPVLRGGIDDGCLLAIVDLRQLLADTLRRTPMRGQLVTIRNRQRVLLQSEPIPDRGEAGLTQTADLGFANATWTVTDIPSRQWAASRRSAFPEVALGAGVLLAILTNIALESAVWAADVRADDTPPHATLRDRKSGVVHADTANRLVSHDLQAGSGGTSSSLPSEPIRPLNILLVEDNAINRRVAQRMLGIAGHRVTVAENGRLALALLEQSSFDAILMDVQMPEMDGFETTAAIRKQEEQTGRHIPIIAMTAHALKGDRERCRAAGMDGYIAKPMTSGELQAALAAIQPPAPAEEAFDLAAALRRADGDLDFLRELVGMLHEDAPPQLAAILAAVESQDAGRLERAAHQLKGSLVPFEAPSAMKAVQALETMGHTQELSGTADGYRVLDAEMQRLLGAIKELTSPFNSHHAIPVLNDGTNHSEDSPCIV